MRMAWHIFILWRKFVNSREKNPARVTMSLTRFAVRRDDFFQIFNGNEFMIPLREALFVFVFVPLLFERFQNLQVNEKHDSLSERQQKDLKKLLKKLKEKPINPGEVAEWSNAHAWKACESAMAPRVQIPSSPPFF